MKVIAETTIVRDGQTFTVSTLRPQKARTKQEIRLQTSFRCRGPKTRADKVAQQGGEPIFSASPGVSAPKRKNGKKR
jgi:hypothetical protein